MTDKLFKAAILYYSATGNTKKVADAIGESLADSGIEPEVYDLKEAAQLELYDYNLIFIGSPSIVFLPARPVRDFLKGKLKLHMERGDLKVSSPRIADKRVVVFCTYSGPYTGINQVIPTGKYMAQFFEVLGFEVAAEWYVVGEYHGSPERSTQGRLGDIRGRPNQDDLRKVRADTAELIRSL